MPDRPNPSAARPSWAEEVNRTPSSPGEPGVPGPESRSRIGQLEEAVTEKLSKAGLVLDRFERLTNELKRLKVRRKERRQEVKQELDSTPVNGKGLSPLVYFSAIAFLGVVEFFANAPVFRSLLPRDPITEQQVRSVSETAVGWMAGLERTVAEIILRPDAALLAAGVVIFLLVLAHFFGHSLRNLVLNRDRRVRRDAVAGGTMLENAVPMLITGLGLALVLGVLYEARVSLAEVGEARYEQDIAAVEELRRQAGWLRSDGDLLAANEMTDRAEDLQAVAEDLREYTASMSRLSFPIFLLNLTLVLAAITAAYFHRRGAGRESFDEAPFEEERAQLVDDGERAAAEISSLLDEVSRHLRQLRNSGAVAEPAPAEARSGNGPEPALLYRSPESYDDERSRLAQRFGQVRQRFNQESVAWSWER